MRFEVDQSIRIEETNRDTILAMANKKAFFTARLIAKTKRQLKEYFHYQNRPRIFPIIIFAVAIAVLIEKSKYQVSDLTIDEEYPGHRNTIVEIINQSLSTPVEISFMSIGKKSPAHYAAYGVFIGKRKEDTTMVFEEIVKKLP